jgi:hypothetical protein
MKRLFLVGAVSILMLTSVSTLWAKGNLNSSRSNIYRMVYDGDVVTPAQATTLLTELNKIGPADEKKLRQWLPATFKRLGIETARIKRIFILMGRQVTCASAPRRPKVNA